MEKEKVREIVNFNALIEARPDVLARRVRVCVCV